MQHPIMARHRHALPMNAPLLRAGGMTGFLAKAHQHPTLTRLAKLVRPAALGAYQRRMTHRPPPLLRLLGTSHQVDDYFGFWTEKLANRIGDLRQRIGGSCPRSPLPKMVNDCTQDLHGTLRALRGCFRAERLPRLLATIENELQTGDVPESPRNQVTKVPAAWAEPLMCLGSAPCRVTALNDKGPP